MRTGTGAVVLVVTAVVLLWWRAPAAPDDSAGKIDASGKMAPSSVPVPQKRVLQPADGPIFFQPALPGTALQTITLSVTEYDAQGHGVRRTKSVMSLGDSTSGELHVIIHREQMAFTSDNHARVSAEPLQTALSAWTASPVSLPGVAVVHGSLSGDIRQMLVLLSDLRVFPFASNERVVYYTIPFDAPPGRTGMTFIDGTHAGYWATTVLKLVTSVDQPVLHKHQRTNGHVGLSIGNQSARGVNQPPP